MDIEVNVSEGKGLRRILEVKVPASDVETEFTDAIKGLKREVKIDGFRPGKIPSNIIYAKFKKEISQSVMEKLLPEVFHLALKKADLKTSGEPELKDVHLKRGEPLTFRAILDIKPRIEPVDYKGLKLKGRPVEVTDEDVEKTVDALRDKLAVVNEVDRPSQRGDIVMVEIIKLKGGDNIGEEEDLGTSDIELDEKRTLPEFVNNLVGKSVGDTVEFSVKYPADYFDKDLANYTYLYKATIKHIREKKLPKTDEELIKALNVVNQENNEPVDPEKFREMVKNDLQEKAHRDSQRELESQAIEQITKTNQFDIPLSILEKTLEGMVQSYRHKDKREDEEKLKEKLKPVAENFIRWKYLVEAIAEKENIKVSKEEINAQRRYLHQNRDLGEEEIEKHLADWEDRMLEKKVLDFIIENAEIEDITDDDKDGEENAKGSIIITPEGR